MRSLLLPLALALSPLTLAQENIATVVVFVTADPTPTAPPTLLQQIASTESATPTSVPSSTLATSISSTSASPSTAPGSSAGTEYSSPGSAGSAASGSDLGASGSDGGSSFHLSQGGIAGIIVVVVLVALFGIASTILFVIAKRRSWTIRETLKRGSRRLTGRGPTGPPSSSRKGVMIADRGSRKAIRIDSPQRQPQRGGLEGKGWGHKRGLVVEGRERDVEKGVRALDGRGAGARKETGWVGKVWGGGWK